MSIDEARRRAIEAIWSVENTLAEPRDPDVVERAAAWESDWRERNPKPQPRAQPDLRREMRAEVARMRDEFHRTLEALAEEVGRVTGQAEKAAREARQDAAMQNAKLMVQVLAMRERLDALEARAADEPEPATPQLRMVG